MSFHYRIRKMRAEEQTREYDKTYPWVLTIVNIHSQGAVGIHSASHDDAVQGIVNHEAAMRREYLSRHRLAAHRPTHTGLPRERDWEKSRNGMSVRT